MCPLVVVLKNCMSANHAWKYLRCNKRHTTAFKVRPHWSPDHFESKNGTMRLDMENEGNVWGRTSTKDTLILSDRCECVVFLCSYLFTGLLQSHKSELRLNLLKRKSEQFLYLAKRCINNTVVCYVNFWIFICTCNVLFFCSKEPLTDSPVSILSPTVLPPDKKGAPPHHQVRGKAPFTKSAKFALTKRLAATTAFSRAAAVRCSLSEQWKVQKQTTPSIHTNTEIKCTVYVPKCHTATWWQSG